MAETAVAEQLDQLRQDLGAREAHPVDREAPKAEAKPKRPRRRKATAAAAKAKATSAADVTTADDDDITPQTVIERLEQEAQRNPILTAAAMLGLGLVLGRLLSR